jgi:hypothetical protein
MLKPDKNQNIISSGFRKVIPVEINKLINNTLKNGMLQKDFKKRFT